MIVYGEVDGNIIEEAKEVGLKVFTFDDVCEIGRLLDEEVKF